MELRPKLDRRRKTFGGLILRFSLKYSELLGFLAGWSAYPIGTALLALLAN